MLDTGIHLYVGRPGAGKSLVAVRKLLDIVQQERRPIYTNLPLKWRVVRLFLHMRGGAELAGLIRPLTERHFRAFLSRFSAKHSYVEERRGFVPLRQARADFDVQHPAVIDGMSANWIPPGSLVVVDEAQHWFPNPALSSTSRAKTEPPELLSYLTMHRHMLHQVWFLTQATRQVSATIKTLAVKFWDVRNMGEEAVAWGLRWKHLGVTACGYRAFDPLEWNDGDDPGTPLESFIMLPNAPWNRWLFRLYSSFTHAGSASELRAALEEARIMSGVSADGKLARERQPRKPWRERLPRVTPRRLLRWAVVVLLGAVVYGAGVTSWKRDPSVLEAAKSEAVVAVRPAVLQSRMVSYSPSGVRLAGGRVLRTGEVVDGCKVLYVSDRGAVADWNGECFGWVLGEPSRFMGRTAEVCAIAGRVGEVIEGADGYAGP